MESAARPTKAKLRRFAEFDSLRGVAAFTIAISHWRRIYEGRVAIPHFTPLRLLFIGHAFVLLFFALSGLVLSLPQVLGKPVHYSSFAAKRIIRIYPAYLLALAIAVACSFHWHGADLYGTTWGQQPDLASVLDHVRLLGSYDFHRYNVAYWTLTQEMRISLFVPLLCLIVLSSGVTTTFLLVSLLTALAVALEKHWALPEDVVRTVAYIAVFLIGSLCAKHLHDLNHHVASLSRSVYWLAVASVLTLMTAWPTLLYHLHLNSTAWDVLLGIPAASLILLALRPDGLSPLLLHPVPVFLGKISYSFYLLHGTVLWICCYVFAGRLSPLVWLPGFLLISVLVSCVFYEAVEVPSIHAGRYVENLLKRRWPSWSVMPHPSAAAAATAPDLLPQRRPIATGRP